MKWSAVRQRIWMSHNCNGQHLYRNIRLQQGHHLSSYSAGLSFRMLGHCGGQCPSAFNSFELPSWMLYQDVQLLWDPGLGRGESGYSL
jgi:hypothetical protein